MATFEESFLYPLILLLITVGLSGGLVTWLSNWLESRRQRQQNKVEEERKAQEVAIEDKRKGIEFEVENKRKEREFEVENHRKELEIKVDIVSKMAEVISNHRANAFLALAREKGTYEEDAYYEYLKKQHIETSIISSKLESYFPEADVRERWEHYYPVLVSYNNASVLYFWNRTEKQDESLKYHLGVIRKYLSDNEEIKLDGLTRELTYNKDLWFKVTELVMQRGDKIIKDLLKQKIRFF